MPKPKQFLKENKKKSKHVPSAPTTADEYLAAGVDFEEAGEKWRGGDAAKSTRFFVRAIDCYDEALKKFPQSFDLAYNKARIQYELTQYPKLLQQLPGTLVELLNTALQSSKYALSLNPANADVLFNTAQILTSIVESLDGSRQNITIDPLPLLEEALDLFQQCLRQQEALATDYQAQTTAVNAQDDMDDVEEGGVSISDSNSNSDAGSSTPQDDRWATIVEPVTNDTLLDTLLAQLETLTTLSHLIPLNYPQALETIRNHAAAILDTKFDAYLSGTGRDIDSQVTRANFICAFADAQYRSNAIDTPNYSQILESAYKDIDLSKHPKGLVEAAESYISYNTSLRVHPDGSAREYVNLRWKALSRALEQLTAASKLPDADNLEKIHMARGDTELLRFQLGQGETRLEAAATNAAVLLRNAEKFYRGSQAVAKTLGFEETVIEAMVKESLAMALGNNVESIQDGMKKVSQTRVVLEEAFEDGLITRQQLKLMGIGAA